MPALSKEQLAAYLEGVLGRPVVVEALAPMGEKGAADVKALGYGEPVRVTYRCAGEPGVVVLETVTPGPYGHQHMADRAAQLLWAHGAFNRMPGHVRSVDVGAFVEGGSMISLGRMEEAFQIMELASGEPYARDLERLRDGGELLPRDVARCDVLCDSLVAIHAERGEDPSLYVRHVRDLVGHGECIMGVLDGYPQGAVDPEILLAIEQECVRWRWRIRGRVERCRRVHGDFHPWNLLFRDEATLALLDRSRGEYGEPANDVTCLALNWLFFSLQRSGRLEGAFRTLWDRFFERYLTRTGDNGLLEVAPPFAAFRLLVMASPAWYPRLPDGVREALLTLARDLLAASRLDPTLVADTVGRRR